MSQRRRVTNLGVITNIDEDSKTLTAQGDGGQLPEGSLGFVLARHNPAVIGSHFGREYTEPLLGLHDTMARDFLIIAKSEWQQAQEQQQIEMTM